MQSTAARLCSMLHLGVLPKDLLTSYPGLPPWSLCLAIWGRLTRQIILSLLILPQTKLHAPLLTFSLRNFSRKCVLLHSLSPHNRLCNGPIVTFPCTIQHAHHTPTPRKKIKLIKKNNFKKKLRIKNFKIRKRSPTPLSHAVDCSSLSPHTLSLHVREFLRSGPWAVGSNSQPTALGQLLVTCSRLWLACAPHKGVSTERSLSSQLKFSAHSAWPVPCQMQATTARLCSTWGRFLEHSWGGPPPYI